MIKIRILFLTLTAIALAGCTANSQACTTDALRPTIEAPTTLPAWLEIGGSPIQVDQVVSGSLCDGDWEGVVYVTCEAQAPAWEGEPLFLQYCDLEIAPGTVVYVAAHKDQAYYKGCSCHTGEEP
jgi:hypothetical protein